jgi:serine/threonine-protein kinase
MPDSEEGGDSTAFARLLQQVASSPAPSLLSVGAAVGEYRIQKLLGRGAFGAVYHASHALIGKQVALKVLGAQFSEDPAMSARFVDEARAVNRIAHPNIVDIFGFGTLADGRKYCVMELLNGRTLGDRLEQSGPPPFAEALAILRQVAGALDAAHQNGVVHRDLKPDNVFLCEAGGDASGADGAIKVKLLDFGIAQIADGVHQRTGTNMVLGTPAYMSPEQCLGARVDFRADIYALGVVAFELFTGTQPFRAGNAFQLGAMHVNAEPPAPSSLRPELSVSVDAAILRLLAKAPERRPPSASAGVEELSDALQRVDGTAAAVSTVRTPVVSNGDKRTLLGAGLAGLVLLLAVLVFRASRASEEPLVSTEAAPTAAAVVASPSSQPRPEPVELGLPSNAPLPAAQVQLKIDGEPAAARVFWGDSEVGQLGQPFLLPRSDAQARLSIRAPGFAAREISVVPSEDRALSVKLRRLAKKPELEY